MTPNGTAAGPAHKASMEIAVSERSIENSNKSYLPAWGATMNGKILVSLVLVALLSGCGQDQPENHQQKTFGGQLGDSYKGMLDEATQGALDANEHTQHTERAVRERDQ
jgi:hypothetical protein